jgi:TusA-related sulfurtransferase
MRIMMVSADFSTDLGDLSCGELTMALKMFMDRLPFGVVAQITARDPAAHIDIAAWCHVTQNELVSAPQGPDDFSYLIRKKECS